LRRWRGSGCDEPWWRLASGGYPGTCGLLGWVVVVSMCERNHPVAARLASLDEPEGVGEAPLLVGKERLDEPEVDGRSPIEHRFDSLVWKHTSRNWILEMARTSKAGTYRGRMPQRQSIDGPPNSYVDDWPDGRASGPMAVEHARGLAKNLARAIGEESLRSVARRAEVDHTTIAAVLVGDRWADLVTVAKLEQALEARLWPDLVD